MAYFGNPNTPGKLLLLLPVLGKRFVSLPERELLPRARFGEYRETHSLENH